MSESFVSAGVISLEPNMPKRRKSQSSALRYLFPVSWPPSVARQPRGIAVGSTDIPDIFQMEHG